MWLPIHCPLCLQIGGAPCVACRSRLAPAPVLPEPDGVDEAVALFAHEGEGRRLVARLKFHNHRDAIDALAAELSSFVGERPDLVTWVPTTARRRRERGFDQAELLARALGRRLGVRVRSTLRSPRGAAQTGQGRSGRSRRTFVARRAVTGVVLVVDDVRTTGASLAAAATALRGAGAESILAATLGATADHRSRAGHADRPLRCP